MPKRVPSSPGKRAARKTAAPRALNPDLHAKAAVSSGPAIVGIGASAGGIDALSRFLSGMPADSGLAFIIVLHLDPTRESGLAPLLARHTPMPVVEITDGIRTEANTVYVIAPDKSLTINGDRLCLSKPAEPRGHRHPVDVLFASLAEQRRERAIGIVLSGSGNNGSHGLNEIKANGGMTLAQNPETAQFDGMPRSAIAAGAVDHVLTIEEMPDMLLRYIRHRYISEPDGIETDALSRTALW
jgi:two-component system, chemotaxis family, CheB/CheR fusion protein